MTWIKMKTALGIAAAVLMVGGATTTVLSNDSDERSIRPASSEEKAFAEKIINATRDRDYEAFIANGDSGFKTITKAEFNAVCTEVEKKFKDGHDLTYFGDLKTRGYQTTLWRVSYENGSDDSVGRMSVRNGKVVMFLLQ